MMESQWMNGQDTHLTVVWGGKHYHSPLQQQHIHYLNRATVSGSHGSCVHSDQPALGHSLQKHLGTLMWLFNHVFSTSAKKITVQYTTEFGVKGAFNRTRQHFSPGGDSERVQGSGSVGVPASNIPKNFSCWSDWNVMWILSSFYFTLSTVQKWKHAHAIKSKHSHPARLTRCLLTEAKGLSGSHRKVCKSKETSNKHLTMLTEIQRRKKLSKVSKSCFTHILHLAEFVVRAQKAKTTSSQCSLADKDDSLSFTEFSMWKETALTSVYWDTNLLVVVRGQVMEQIKRQKPFKLIRTQYLNRLNIHRILVIKHKVASQPVWVHFAHWYIILILLGNTDSSLAACSNSRNDTIFL